MALTTAVDEVAPGLTRLRHLFVNLYLLGQPGAWVLVDAGLPGAADSIRLAAADLFGADARP